MKAKVVASNNPDNLLIAGKIIDETKNTVVLEDSKHERKKILKQGTILRVKSSREEYDINCSKIMKRSQERTKK